MAFNVSDVSDLYGSKDILVPYLLIDQAAMVLANSTNSTPLSLLTRLGMARLKVSN